MQSPEFRSPPKPIAYVSNRGDLVCNLEESFWGDQNGLTVR